jgi:hypothetical protein
MRGCSGTHLLVLAVLSLSLLVAVAACSSDGGATAGDEGLEHDTANCVEGNAECADLQWLRRCEGGDWVEQDCAEQLGWLCDPDQGACVAPWLYGSPSFGQCPNDPHATPETIAEKAAVYDDIARRLHVHPELMWMSSVTLAPAEIDCEGGATPPCYGSDPVVPESAATLGDVEAFHTGENDGLWSSLYLASQAYRYATTKDPEALEMLKLLLDGEVVRMEITGVPGLFTRQYIPPNVPGIACPTDDAHYTTDVEKDDNRWVQIREDGCAWVIPHETGVWTKSDHCDLDDYAGWCFLDNVSMDEYSGHMFALAVIGKIVDDEEVRATVADLVGQVADHLIENDLTLVDWDGRITEHGRIYATSFTDPPGFNATVALLYMLMAHELTGREEYKTYYDDCLLQRNGTNECLPWPLEKEIPYDTLLEQMLLYVGGDGCRSNWNNISMMYCAVPMLAWYADDSEIRDEIQRVFDKELMRKDHPISFIGQHNAWFDFLWAAHKKLGPDSDGPAYEPVEDGLCMLRQFDPSQSGKDLDSFLTHDHYCYGRLHKEDNPESSSSSEFAMEIYERCPATFVWWGNPYRRHRCSANPRVLRPPTGYLLPYWMGRYYGFITDDT